MAAPSAVLKSEWTKVRTVSSTVWTLATALVLTVAIGALLSGLMNSTFDDLSATERATFDPTFVSFFGMVLGQLAMITFGVLTVSTEYSSGMIKTSLAAVPQRGTFYAAKIAVAAGLTLVVGLITSFLSFFLGQALLGEHSAAITDDNVLRAVVGAGLYLALMALFSMGVATMLRSTVLSLGILMALFFLISTILISVPATSDIAQWLPDQAGTRAMQVVPGAMNSETTPYGPWGGLGIMVAWVAAALIGGYIVLKRRDA